MNKKIYISLLLITAYQQATANDQLVYPIKNFIHHITSSTKALQAELTTNNLQAIPAAIKSSSNTNIKATLQLGYTLLPYASFIVEKYNEATLQPLVASYAKVVSIFNALDTISSSKAAVSDTSAAILVEQQKRISTLINSSSVGKAKEFFTIIHNALQTITTNLKLIQNGSTLMYAAHATTLPKNTNHAATALKNSFKNSLHKVQKVITTRQQNVSKVPLVLETTLNMKKMYHFLYNFMNFSSIFFNSLGSATITDASAKIIEALQLAAQNLHHPNIATITDGIYNFNTYLNDTQVQTKSTLSQTLQLFQIFNIFVIQAQIT